MNKSTMLKLFIVLGLVAGTFLMVMPAQAKVAVGTSNGWEFSTDGFINAFAVVEDADETVNGGDAAIATHSGDLMNAVGNEKSFRVRTGLLPGLIAFNVKAPTTNGIDVAARVGFYPQIQDPDQKRSTAFGAQIDLREAFMTADGGFGQVLAGRALHLYQGKNILTDMTLFGAGVQGGSGGGTTLGYIGFGYIYTNFGAQIRYTTPDFGGVKIAVGILDPSIIDGGGYEATITESPGYEAEISYAGEVGSGVKLQAWVSGMSQDADVPAASSPTGADKSVTCSGVAAGVGVDVVGVHVLASGFSGTGNGTAIMMGGALDGAAEEIDSTGLLGQVSYTIMGATKIGIQYGQVDFDETADGLADRLASAATQVDKRTAYTVGVYHDITPNWKVMAEYTKAKTEWFDGADREANAFALGTFFIW
jgi:hypothetical protein